MWGLKTNWQKTKMMSSVPLCCWMYWQGPHSHFSGSSAVSGSRGVKRYTITVEDCVRQSGHPQSRGARTGCVRVLLKEMPNVIARIFCHFWDLGDQRAFLVTTKKQIRLFARRSRRRIQGLWVGQSNCRPWEDEEVYPGNWLEGQEGDWDRLM